MDDWHEDRYLGHNDNVNDSIEWFMSRGYQAAPMLVAGCPYFGVVYARPNEPAHLVTVGNWVRFDGTEVTQQ
ncbi:hypothetical protein ACWGA9_06255 [Streptomyces sp. NPDC054950]